MDPSTPDKDALSIPATALYRLGLPLLTSTLYIYSPATALCVPFVAAPTAALLYQRSRLPPTERPSRLETIIWTFLGAAVLVPTVATTVQTALSYATALLFFGDRTNDYVTEFTRGADEIRSLPADMITKRAALAHGWPYIAYLMLFSFSMAGLSEEACKYIVLKLLERRKNKAGEGKLSAREYMLYATVIGLGFSFTEGIAFIYATATNDTAKMVFVTAVERVLYGTTAHVLTAVLTGSRTAKASQQADGEKASWLRIMLPSILYHGAGNAALFGACAIDGHPGWVHPTTVGKLASYSIAPLALVTGLAVHVARAARDLGVSWYGV